MMTVPGLHTLPQPACRTRTMTTSEPMRSSSRAIGSWPKTMSAPALSTNIRTRLKGGCLPDLRASSSSGVHALFTNALCAPGPCCCCPRAHLVTRSANLSNSSRAQGRLLSRARACL